MKAIKLLSWTFYSATLVLVLCFILNVTFKYSTQIFALLLISSSVLFFYEAYNTRKDKK
jgi:hypothetical protein